tara:strand:+ start:327 stop:632 length:306 start_codon:yes stop_codon:yes gene_type:complete
MSVLSKAKGLVKKLETVVKSPENLEALAHGVYHFKNKNDTIEALKDKRAAICDGCDLLEFDDFEPVKDEDERISGKMCGDCFCSLPYFLRQTKKGCSLNKW